MKFRFFKNLEISKKLFQNKKKMPEIPDFLRNTADTRANLFSPPPGFLREIPTHGAVGATPQNTFLPHFAPDPDPLKPSPGADEMRAHLLTAGDLYGHIFQNAKWATHFAHEQKVFSPPDAPDQKFSGEVFSEFAKVGDIFFARKYFYAIEIDENYQTHLKLIFTEVSVFRESGAGGKMWQKAGESEIHSENPAVFDALFSEIESAGFSDILRTARKKSKNVLGKKPTTLELSSRKLN